MTSENIVVVGLGYVGCVTAACLASLGHRVVGVDRDAFKVKCVNDGLAPFYEPGLEELVLEGRNAGLLSATTEIRKTRGEIILVCVGTPSERNGNLDLSYLRRSVEEVASALREQGRGAILAVRSTVYPGTAEEIVMPLLKEIPGTFVVSHPEFLREGSAVKDFLDPSLIVAGGEDPAAVQRVASLYTKIPTVPSLVSLRTAEMIKYSCNAFHAAKVAFANEIGSLCGRLGINGEEVMATLCADTKLNVSAAYLKPGFAFGGSCLPKDLRAIMYRSHAAGLELPLLAHVLPSNEAHLKRSLSLALDLGDVRLGIVGLAFKENTDDLRESPVVSLLEGLIGKGRSIRVFDPHIRLDSIYGTNRNYLLNAVPHIGRLMTESLEALVGESDALIVTQALKPELNQLVQASGKKILNLAKAPNYNAA